MLSLEASIRSGNCCCCCCSAGRRAQRLELITAIKAVVLKVKEHTGSTTLTGWQRVAHAARHVCRPTSSLRRLTAGGCRTLPMDRQTMPAKWLCLVVSGIDVRSLGVWVRCGAVPAASHLGARHVRVDVDPGVVELSVVMAYTSCGLGGPEKHRKGRGADTRTKE